MLTILFYVVLAWVLISLGHGVYASIVGQVSNDRVVGIVVNTLRLPYDAAVRLFK